MFFINIKNDQLQLLASTFAPVKKMLLLVLCLVVLKSYADDFTYHILDAKNRQPVQGAMVMVNFTATGKTAVYLPDYKGKVKVPASDKTFSLVVRCLGFDDYKAEDAAAIAQSQILLTPSPINLNEVAVTAAYETAPSTQSAFHIKIIDKEEIQKMAAVNVADVLNKQLGSKVSNDQAFGSVLSLQGMQMQNVKVLIDGVPVIGRLDGNIDLSELNLNDVERIEIIEGPMSTAFGTDAIAGVINLITKTAINKNRESSLTAYYESIGNYNVDVKTRFRWKDLGVSIAAGRNFFDGEKEDESQRVMQWKPKEQYFGSLLLTHSFKRLKLNYKLQLFDEKITDKGSLTITPVSAYAFDNYYFVFRQTHVMSGDYFLNGINKINAQVSYSGYSRTKKVFRKDMETLQKEQLYGPEFQDTTGFNAWNIRSSFVHLNTAKTINYQAGIDFNIEKGSGKRISSNAKPINDYAVFASAEYTGIKKLLVRPGLRAAYNTQFKSPLTPSLNVKYDVLSGHTLRAAYGRGFRAPGIKELYLYFVDNGIHNVRGSSELQPESSDNYQLVYTFKPIKNKYNYQAEASAFYNDVNNLITLAQQSDTSTLYTYINVGQFKSRGVSVTNSITWKNLSLNAGFCYTGTTSQLNSESDKLSFYTEANAGADYNFNKIGLTIACFYKYNGKVPFYQIDANGETVILKSDAYHLLDVTVAKKFWKEKITFTTGLKNIVNVKTLNQQSTSSSHGDQGSRTFVSPGRSWFAKLMFTI